MTQLLEKAFSEASALPEIQQNILARWIIDELLAEKKWDVLFSETEDDDMATLNRTLFTKIPEKT